MVYLFGITASLTQFYWLANVVVDNLWPVIMLGLFCLTLFIALQYLLLGFLFRIVFARFGTSYIILFPAVWVVIEWLRSLGEMSFPWALLGYSLTPILPLAQIASLGGVYLLSFIIILGNCLVFELIRAIYKKRQVKKAALKAACFSLLLVIAAIWGVFRLHNYKDFPDTLRVSLLQSNMDQTNWNGRVSLDTAMAITESMVYKAAGENPDVLVFPESGIYCYLENQRREKAQVFTWIDSTRIPMIFGTLHFTRNPDNDIYKYRVYNAVFYIAADSYIFEHYYKVKLVPFSEALPFEGIFPVLSRLNLGESDFARGETEEIYTIKNRYHAGPFLCYEIIYPDFVRRRVNNGADLLINVTNDGWFGRSNGPFTHAAMARMRSIENGVSLARCANSGISMFVDPVGRVLGTTSLYTRSILTRSVPHAKIDTVYRRWGDWVVYASCALLLFFVPLVTMVTHKYKKK